MQYKEYLRKRFKEMKEEDEFKDMSPQEKTQIVANEWKNKEVVTQIEEPQEEIEEVTENDINHKKNDEDDEDKYKYKCECGYYFNEPIPERCPKCGVELI